MEHSLLAKCTRFSLISYLREIEILITMKALTFAVWMVGLSVVCNSAAAQTTSQEFYVTIGVFRPQHYAMRYTALANKNGFNAQYAINPARKLYYVYLLQSDEKRKAQPFLNKLRVESEYKDAWIFNGHLGHEPLIPVVKGKNDPVKTEAEKKDSVKAETVKKDSIKAETVKKDSAITESVKKDSVIEIPRVVKIDSSTIVKKVPKGKFFIFRFLNGESGAEVRGEIHLATSNKAAQYQAFKANEMVDLLAPRNQAGAYFATTVAPGYKVVETIINYNDPMPLSSGSGPDGEIIIPLTLTRAKRGDYIEFNNVSFYRNSVVMQPQFKHELDGLVDLMKEHQDYEIRIHGHCNGNEPRDIITLGTSTKYFESDPGNVRKTGSAKELTELRAEAARRYLGAQGISMERILTKGEGGKMMVYPQTSVYANYNDRIEVEIIRH